MPTTYWAPNQANVAQARRYTFTVPSGVGNTYVATINGKSVTYASVSGDTAATVATALFNLVNQTTGVPSELTEITWANPSDAVVTATASEPGTPFAGVTVGGVANQGLVMSTGNGLVSGIATLETQANLSQSDVLDPQNWLRVTTPAPGVRAIPVDGDDVDVRNSAVPMLVNLDRLAAVRFNTYTRWQSFTATIGLPTINANGYREWRATYFWFNGPAGSVPAGGLQMVLGQGSGSGPTRERYNVQSQPTTLTCLAAGQAEDDFGIRFLGVHTANTFTAVGGVSLGIATGEGEVSNLTSCQMDGATVGIGAGVTWTAGSTLTTYGGEVTFGAAPGTIVGANGTQFTFTTTGLTWATVTVQGNCTLTFLCGGVITTLTMTVGCNLDKSQDMRGLTITNSTIDGDSCFFSDPLNVITWTNATVVKQQVQQGPFQFTGSRTVKVT